MIAIVLVWGSTSVADLSVSFPVTTSGGTPVGSVTVQVTDDPGPPPNKGITGGFTSTVPKPPPPDAKPSLAGALEQLGEHHFNWFQVVVKDNHPPAGHTPPYIDPPNGGAFGQWADDKPWYWDETKPKGPPYPEGYNEDYHWEYQQADTNGDGVLDTFKFEDFPWGEPGTDLEFYTWLVSCNADGSLHSFHGGFNWTWKRGSVLCDIVGPVSSALAYQYYYSLIPEPTSAMLAGVACACLMMMRLVRRPRAGMRSG
ncbi:MAG: hypothetical protein RBS80_26035 [Thermoguttaceae bacterium]|nr:hypothetical protein [Thermoguttaceae bacterium]